MRGLSCQSEIDSEVKFCPFCGKEVSFLKCSNCGKEVKTKFLFCSECGIGIKNNKRKRKEQCKKGYLLIARLIHCLTLLLLLSFVFLPIGKMSFNQMSGVNFVLSSIPEELTLSITIIDTSEVFGYVNEDVEIEEYLNDVEKNFIDNLDNETLNSASYKDLTNSQKKQVQKAVNEINFLELFSVFDVRSQVYITVIFILVLNVIFYLAALFYLAAFIYSITSFSKRKDMKRILKMQLWVFITSLVLYLFSFYFTRLFSLKVGSGPQLILLLSFISFGLLLTLSYIFGDIKFRPRFLIKKGITIFALIFALFLINSNSLKYSYTYENFIGKESTVVDSEPIEAFVTALNGYISSFVIEIEEFPILNQVTMHLKNNTKISNQKLLNSSIYSSQNFLDDNLIDYLLVMEMIIAAVLLQIALITLLIISLTKNLHAVIKDDNSVKKTNFVLYIVTAGLWVITLFALFYLSFTLNDVYKETLYNYSLKIGLFFYLELALLIGLIFWDRLFSSKEKLILDQDSYLSLKEES